MVQPSSDARPGGVGERPAYSGQGRRDTDLVAESLALGLARTTVASLRTTLPPCSRLFKNGYRKKSSPRVMWPKSSKQQRRCYSSKNSIEVAHTSSNDGYQQYCRKRGLVPHPARFPRQVPDFFLKVSHEKRRFNP